MSSVSVLDVVNLIIMFCLYKFTHNIIHVFADSNGPIGSLLLGFWAKKLDWREAFCKPST